ncbi:MAG: hypothetical protein KatS3mg068_2720 [Candidatus Sericytochromatia bacterium]|nr:MAG: hypothetical protein KatS3mg068_2720 [Candidatus Sericytochromatia bacterium]
MLIHVEVLKSRKQNKKRKIIKYIFFIVLFLSSGIYIYYNHKNLNLFFRTLFLPEDIKFIESKNKQIENKLLIWIQKNNLKRLNSSEYKQYKSLLDDNITVLHYLENSSSNLKEIHYYLTLSYFYKIVLNLDFSQENLIKQIVRGYLPPVIMDYKDYETDIKRLQIFSKKFLALEQDEEKKSDIVFISIFSDILNFKILSKIYYIKINQIQINNLLLLPFYEWFFLVINSNYGDIEKINHFLKSKHFWNLSSNEKLLLQANTYYFKKDYFNLIQIYFKFKNSNNLENLNNINLPYDKFLYIEFLRLLAETYFLQKNYNYSKYYINEIEKLNPDRSDKFLFSRIEVIKNKIKQFH